MLFLQLSVASALLVCASSYSLPGELFKYMNGDCFYPSSLMGSFCVIVTGLDFNADGAIDRRDFSEGFLRFTTDDNACELRSEELVEGYECTLGLTRQYGQWRFDQLDVNNDGVVNVLDFRGGGPPDFSFATLLGLQLSRYRDEYCGDKNITFNAVDVVRCEQARAIKPEDVKC